MCEGFCEVLVALSLRSQLHDVGLHVDVSVKFTVKGTAPDEGEQVKLATGAEGPNVAVTALSASIATVHPPVPVHAPDHPVNSIQVPGVAVKVTVPHNEAEQVLPQFMPEGLLVTVPVPDVETVSV